MTQPEQAAADAGADAGAGEVDSHGLGDGGDSDDEGPPPLAAPADAGSLTARQRSHIPREAVYRLLMGLPPRSGTVPHIFGAERERFLVWAARELWDADLPGAASPDAVRRCCADMAAAGVRAGDSLQAAVQALVDARQVACFVQVRTALLGGGERTSLLCWAAAAPQSAPGCSALAPAHLLAALARLLPPRATSSPPPHRLTLLHSTPPTRAAQRRARARQLGAAYT